MNFSAISSTPFPAKASVRCLSSTHVKPGFRGLSPKENREIPPLDYPRVYQLKRDFPHLTMSINGGIKSLEEAKAHLQHMDGVMVGREAYQNPGILAAVDREIFGSSDTDADPVAVVRAMYPYIERELSQWDVSRPYYPAYVGLVPGYSWRAAVAALFK